MTMTAMGIDKRLQKEYGSGYVGTKEYFKTIDKTMRKRFPERFDDVQSQDDEKSTSKKVSPAEDDTPRRASKPATVVAPASRSTSPNRVKVKASEAAIARRLGVSVEDYARQKAALEGNR
jgi:LysM repeat protein